MAIMVKCCLERIYEDVKQHQAGGDEFRAGAEKEPEKSAEGRFERGRGVFLRVDEFRDEGTQEGADNHAHGRDDEACEQADDGAPAAGLMLFYIVVYSF